MWWQETNKKRDTDTYNRSVRIRTYCSNTYLYWYLLQYNTIYKLVKFVLVAQLFSYNVQYVIQSQFQIFNLLVWICTGTVRVSAISFNPRNRNRNNGALSLPSWNAFLQYHFLPPNRANKSMGKCPHFLQQKMRIPCSFPSLLPLQWHSASSSYFWTFFVLYYIKGPQEHKKQNKISAEGISPPLTAALPCF